MPILHELPADDPTPTTVVDLRQARRIDCPGHPELGVVICSNSAPDLVAVRDISTRGIGLIMPDPIEPGSRLTVLWHYGSVSRWRSLAAEVVRCAAGPDGSWVVGCVLHEPLNTAELVEFLREAL